ncbi:MAG: ankyrin repeat domain-containing protein [Pseudomonadota bacterium]
MTTHVSTFPKIFPRQLFGVGAAALSLVVAICLFYAGGAAAQSTLPGTVIHSFEVSNITPNGVDIEVHYSYDGAHGEIVFGALAKSRDGSATSMSYFAGHPLPGNNLSTKFNFLRPWQVTKVQTDLLEIVVHKPGKDPKPLLTKTFDWPHEWPELGLPQAFPGEKKTSHNERILQDAIAIIDDSDRLGQQELDVAKRNLDTIILDDPNNAQAYLELARIAMKADNAQTENGRYSGLDEAQRLIKVALKVNPGHANSYILLGYVLAVKNQTEEAIAAFKKAQQIGTQNMWLYNNWALALKNANRIDEAIKKYQEGVALTPMPDMPELRSNNRAIPQIFNGLMRLLAQRHDLKAMDALYQKRIAVLNESCQKTRYGEFKLYEMGDFDAAIQNATEAHEQNCRSGARPLLAAAYLSKWALDPSQMSKEQREKLFNQSQAFITDTQQTVVSLASSKFTAKVLPKLKATDIQLDGKDAKGMTPLAYAAAAGNGDAVKALIGAGANADHVLMEGWTPLMIAVSAGEADVVKVLLKAGANMSQKNKGGQSALSIARASGNTAILTLLNTKISY